MTGPMAGLRKRIDQRDARVAEIVHIPRGNPQVMLPRRGRDKAVRDYFIALLGADPQRRRQVVTASVDSDGIR